MKDPLQFHQESISPTGSHHPLPSGIPFSASTEQKSQLFSCRRPKGMVFQETHESIRGLRKPSLASKLPEIPHLRCLVEFLLLSNNLD